jgi:hypothetical protein
MVESAGGEVNLVQLRCDPSVLAGRVRTDGRADRGKLADVSKLTELMQRMDLVTPIPGRESLRIDNTQLAPAEVARQIIEHYALV